MHFRLCARDINLAQRVKSATRRIRGLSEISAHCPRAITSRSLSLSRSCRRSPISLSAPPSVVTGYLSNAGGRTSIHLLLLTKPPTALKSLSLQISIAPADRAVGFLRPDGLSSCRVIVDTGSMDCMKWTLEARVRPPTCLNLGFLAKLCQRRVKKTVFVLQKQLNWKFLAMYITRFDSMQRARRTCTADCLIM